MSFQIGGASRCVRWSLHPLELAAGIVLAQAASAESVQPRPQDPAPTQPQSSPSTEGRSSVPQAPIGHRQPTPRDLPPDVLRRQEIGRAVPSSSEDRSTAEHLPQLLITSSTEPPRR